MGPNQRIRLVLCAHFVLLGWIGAKHNPVFGQLGSLPAGISHVQSARFDLYLVNPPLVRTDEADRVRWEIEPLPPLDRFGNVRPRKYDGNRF